MVGISVQNAVELRDLGTATGLTSFFRSMGGSFGVALMGAILFAGLTSSGASGISPANLLHGGPAMIAQLPEAMRQLVVTSFAHSFRYLYFAGALMCLLGCGFAVFLKELPLRTRQPPAPAPGANLATQAAAERDPAET